MCLTPLCWASDRKPLFAVLNISLPAKHARDLFTGVGDTLAKTKCLRRFKHSGEYGRHGRHERDDIGNLSQSVEGFGKVLGECL